MPFLTLSKSRFYSINRKITLNFACTKRPANSGSLHQTSRKLWIFCTKRPANSGSLHQTSHKLWIAAPNVPRFFALFEFR